MTLDINTVIQNLNELLTNSVNFTDKFYDIFFNQTPMDVTIDLYNENNELVPVTIPNRAKDILVIQDSINIISNLSEVATTGSYTDLINRPESSGGSGSSVFVNVKDKGAKGDGATDDTEALQAACTEAVNEGKILWFEPGRNYIVSSGLTLDASNSNKAVTIFGNGATLVPAATLTSKTKLLNITAPNIVIVGLNVDGFKVPDDDPWDAQNSRYFSAFYLTGSKIGLQGITVKNVCGNGVVLSNYNNVTIEDCNFESVGGSYSRDVIRWGSAIYLISHPDEAFVTINNCKAIGKTEVIDEVTNKLSVSGVLIDGQDSSSIVDTATNIQISNCEVTGYMNSFRAYYMHGKTSGIISNCKMVGNGIGLSPRTGGSADIEINNSSMEFFNLSISNESAGFVGGASTNLSLKNCIVNCIEKNDNDNYTFRSFTSGANSKFSVVNCAFNNIYKSFMLNVTNKDCEFIGCSFNFNAELNESDSYVFVNGCDSIPFRNCVFNGGSSESTLTLGIQNANNNYPKYYSCIFNNVVPNLISITSPYGDTNNVINVNTDLNSANYYAARVLKNGVLQWTSSLFRSLVPLPPCNEIKSDFTTSVDYASNNEVRSCATREIYWESFQLKQNVDVNFLPDDSKMEKVGFALTPSNKYIVIVGFSNSYYPGSYSYTNGFYYFTLDISASGYKNYGNFRHYGTQDLRLAWDDTNHTFSSAADGNPVISRVVLPISYKDFFIPSSEGDSNIKRQIGEIVATTLPVMDDPGLHLLDGQVIEGTGEVYSTFVEYMINLYNTQKRYNSNGFVKSAVVAGVSINSDGIASNFSSIGGGSIWLRNPLYSTALSDSDARNFLNIDVTELVDNVRVTQDFEVDLGKITVTSPGTEQVYVSGRTAGAGGKEFVVGLNGKFYLSSTHVSAPKFSTVDITADETYWVKAGYIKSEEKFYIKVATGSGDNWTWEEPQKVSKVDDIETLSLRIGRQDDGGNPVLGLYDLKQFNISINGEVVFRGIEAPGFCTEYEWQQTVKTVYYKYNLNNVTYSIPYGVCGKYVCDEVNKTIRLPLITGFIEGVEPTVAITEKYMNIGALKEARLPDHRHILAAYHTGTRSLSTENQYLDWRSEYYGGDYKYQLTGSFTEPTLANVSSASKTCSLYSSRYEVQPQALQVLYYVVIGKLTGTNVELDLNNVISQLNSMQTSINNKADINLSNTTSSALATLVSSAQLSDKETIIGWIVPNYSASVAIAAEDEFVAPVNGWISCYGSSSQNHSTTLKIDGVEVFVDSQEGGGDRAGSQQSRAMAFIGKGQTLTGSDSNTLFYPCKGEV